MSTSVCPKCRDQFAIKDNYVHKKGKRYIPFWFIDAMNQFENFNALRCPSCGNVYKDKGLRIMFFFKSPYSFLATTVVFLFVVIISLAIIKYNLR